MLAPGPRRPPLQPGGGRAARAGSRRRRVAGASRPWTPRPALGRAWVPRPDAGRRGRDCPSSRVRMCGAVHAGPGPGRDVTVQLRPDGGYPITPANSSRPDWAQQVVPGFKPGFRRRGSTRSGARYSASVFCAGVLCGSCVALLSPGGPASLAARARSSRGAATGRPGLMNAPSIHSVSAAAGALRRLESVWMHRSACWAGYPSDSSRRLTAAGALHISFIATAQGLRLRRRRRLSPPAPSAGRRSGRPGATSPRTGAEVGYAPARAGGHSPVWGAGPPASGGSRLFAGARPGGSAGPFRAPSGLHDYRDCRPGGGSLRPVHRRSHLTVCRRPCRAAVTTTIRAGAGAPCSPEWSSLRLTAAGRADLATVVRAGLVAP